MIIEKCCMNCRNAKSMFEQRTWMECKCGGTVHKHWGKHCKDYKEGVKG